MENPPSEHGEDEHIAMLPVEESLHRTSEDEHIAMLPIEESFHRTSEENVDPPQVPAKAINSLYMSHFLSYWNSRVFEFASVLFLAHIFPGTILPLSIYALVRGIAAIVFSPTVGWYIDVGERLHVVRTSICKAFYCSHKV